MVYLSPLLATIIQCPIAFHKKKMKACYLIQTHQNPKQIFRLIRTIKKLSPNSLVLISHNFSQCYLDVTLLNDLPGVHVISGRGGRGSFELLQGYIDAVEWLFKSQSDFDWLTNISGQDYPIQSLSEVEQFLSKTNYDGFLEYFKVFSPESHWSIREGQSRYLYKYINSGFLSEIPEQNKKIIASIKIINYLQPFFRINVAYSMVGVRTKTPFHDHFTCYGGSSYCTLSRKCIEYIHNFYKTNTEIVDYYKRVCVPDESFFQTILLNSRLFNLCNNNKVYFNFSGSRNGRPRILTTNDYPFLVQSKNHFARKFDMNRDVNILNLLDQKHFAVSQNSSLEVSP